MVATTLLEGEENAPDVGDHPGHGDDEEEFLHPWAREMYRRGFSFNGGERTKVFLAAGGELVDVSDVSNADSPLDGRALVVADLDDDGDEDLFVHNIQRERHHLFRSEVDPGATGFLSVRLEGAEAEPIGATVEVLPEGASGWTGQVLSRGGGYASCQPPQLVFGLGGASAARVRVRWPWGAVEDFGAVPAGTRVVLRQGAGEARVRPRAGAFTLADPLPPGLKMPRGARLPRLTFEDDAGRPVVLDPAELAAEGPVAVEIWASYCRPCVQKLPELSARARGGERIVAVSVDIPGERPRARALLEATGATFPAYFVSMADEVEEDGFDRLVDLMRLPVPTTLVIGEGGVLVDVLRPRAPR